LVQPAYFWYKCDIRYKASAGNINDREAAVALAFMVDGGVALADFGYRGKKVAQELIDESSLLLITTADAGPHRALISSVRERVETFFSQLWSMFC
jgi:hypothetical protein